MARPKRINPLVPTVQAYIKQHAPELVGARLRLHQLDGPPGGPRYAANVEICTVDRCPYHVSVEQAQSADCPTRGCPLRRSLRLLLDRQGNVLEARDTNTHWS